jgi:hypothetical protein
MAWNVKYNSDTKIIELTYSGLVSPIELKDALSAALSLSKQEGTSLFLADCTDMVGGHSITDLYFLIALYEESGLRGMKEALVLPALKSSVEQVKFYEVACRNRGFNVKIFSQIQDATAWLQG